MKKNKVLKTLIVTFAMLFLGIFFKMKTAEAIQFNIYDPRSDQHYQVQVSNIFCVSSELAKATGLPKNLFLIDALDLWNKEDYDLELPIEQVAEEGVLYNIYRNQEVVVAGLARNIQDVVIKSEINSKKVTEIGANAFAETRIRSVTFDHDSAVTKIHGSAFKCCGALTTVTLPNSLISIDNNNFFKCGALTNITLSNSLVRIGRFCFAYCYSLSNIVLPNSLINICDYCFYNCPTLANVTLSNSLIDIGNNCFSGGCGLLTNITLPDSLTYIGGGTFSMCFNLQQVNLGTNSQLDYLGSNAFQRTKINELKFRRRLNAIHQFQDAEEKRADRLASRINLTDQKYQRELHNIYSLFNRHCSTADLISAYDALTRKVGFSLGEDHPDFIKLKQEKKHYIESLSQIEQERASEMMRIKSYE